MDLLKDLAKLMLVYTKVKSFNIAVGIIACSEISQLLRRHAGGRFAYQSSWKILREHLAVIPPAPLERFMIEDIMYCLESYCEGDVITDERMSRANLYAEVLNEILIAYVVTRQRPLMRRIHEKELRRLLTIHKESSKLFGGKSGGQPLADLMSIKDFKFCLYSAMGIKAV